MAENHIFKEGAGGEVDRGSAPHRSREFSVSDQRGDTVLFQTRWMTVKQTKHGFHFAERAGRDSVALFLIQQGDGNEPRVLIGWQRSAYGEERDKNYPAPITGSIDTPISFAEHAVEEAYEEAGYQLRAEDLTLLTQCACSTQSNELCFLYLCDVTHRPPAEERERISWEPLSFLRSCEYATCQLGYFLIQEHLARHLMQEPAND